MYSSSPSSFVHVQHLEVLLDDSAWIIASFGILQPARVAKYTTINDENFHDQAVLLILQKNGNPHFRSETDISKAF